ncbi:ShlB/FhaC/HecB family hemolysin secretion/activation protein [Cardiobacterium valvarum]|uniref:POTRA domain protein, ShlB-type n=1 Tax=Cardiobacterium valvarum F0432 TaxID=797473 RepID=G9ZBQ6_9GAMM|nr:ShlB/FhaC/HecB family hemolysin secretion/activation protein [Cardiobacterium valvarum]EHM56019.1 POTRA domain protein, ShlB-type [Cardiobacterium valvarum F0432]
MRYLPCLLLLAAIPVTAQQQLVSPAQLEQQAEARQTEINRTQAPRGFTPGERSSSTQPPHPDTAAQTRCLPIQRVVLDGERASRFSRYLKQALSRQALQPRRTGEAQYSISRADRAACLSAADIERLGEAVQNAVIDAGLVTSRIVVADQDLNSGNLHLTILPGYAGDKSLTPDTINRRTPSLRSTIPVRRGELLNLRDIEQGLENLRRLPTVEAGIDIVPGGQMGQSDLQVRWQQQRWWRFNFAVDDSGSKATGKYVGTLGLSLDNPLRLSDTLALNYSRNLLPGKKQRSRSGHSGRGRSDNHAANYSLPLGYWTLELGANRYYYDQAVAGQTRTYHYQGTSTQEQANLSRTLYRNARHKLEASVGVWQKTSKSYVDDAEITVQRRRQGGWQAGITHTAYLGTGNLQSSLNYKKGTGAFSSLPAPETAWGEGTLRFAIWTGDVNWQQPFTLGQQTFIWNSRLHGQWTDDRLTPVDRLSIGGRYNVRGYNGEITLSGDKGAYLRNDLQWRYRGQHGVYLALDGGHVSGPATARLPGKTLLGGALGLKGRWDARGAWQYDIFIGTPLHQPDTMNADKIVGGFNINYNY